MGGGTVKTFIAVCSVAVMFVSGAALAGPKKGHPNLQAAAKLIKEASAKISAAQVANEFDMEGHAAKAKELLAQAEGEINQAAEAANENKK
jgi:hypothetical protein